MNKNNLKLHVEDLTVSFRTTQGLVRAVRGVSFDLFEGETLAIVGESGSGKSVSSRAIMGILAPNAIIDDGKIIYEGQDLTKVDEDHFHEIRGKKIGMIFQDPMSSLNPIMKIGYQITEGMLLNGKRLKNKYKSLIHSEKVAYTESKKNKQILIDQYKQDKAAIKAGTSTKDAIVLKQEFDASMKAINLKISETKKAYSHKKPVARAEVAALWDAEQARVGLLVSELELQLKNATDQPTKKKIRQEIENLQEGLRRFKQVTKKEAYERAIKIMTEVGIPFPEKRFTQYPFQFSGGMRQRIVIAIALTADPDILICDEPTTALDVTIQAQILELINKLKRERELSVIFITHDLGVVANMSDRIAVMYAGKIVEIGTSEDIFYNPKHPYTWALMSSIPDLNTKEKLIAIPGTPPNMLFPPKGDAFADRNSYAMRIDFEEQPPMFQISDTHFAATWLLHPQAPKVEMPEIVRIRIDRMTKLSEVKSNE